jgi:hypothetical protein
MVDSRNRRIGENLARVLICRIACLLGIILMWAAGSVSLLAKDSSSIPEEIEWTWEVRPPHADPTQPNVLLLGDSITRSYFPQVRKDLDGVANVYLMATSTSVGDPRLPHQIAEFMKMEHASFRVVHFNNGMHGWGYTETQYKAAFPEFMTTVRKLTERGGTLIWASITPVRSDDSKAATNVRIEARNEIAGQIVRLAGIALDDQHSLMMKHRDLYDDEIHFNSAGATIQGKQVAAMIKQALAHPPN